MKKQEVHVFILWENSRYMEDKILKDIAKKFDILQTFNIRWAEEYFANNLSRLYGKKLQKGHKKKEKAGSGDFLAVIVMDNNPVYAENNINTNTAAAKSLYRQWTNGGHLVHASDNLAEAEENMMFLIGMTTSEFLTKYGDKSWTGEHVELHQEPIGAPEWQDEKDLFSFLDKIPDTTVRPIQDTHLIIHPDVYKISRLLNATKRLFFMKRNLYQIPINGENKFIYIRKPM